MAQRFVRVDVSAIQYYKDFRFFVKFTVNKGNRSGSKALQRLSVALGEPINPKAAGMETRPTSSGYVGRVSIPADF